jgi:hypothetical protein
LNRFAGPDLPLVSLTYGASESIIGVNLDLREDPSSVLYTILPREAFWEFIPVDSTEDGTFENGTGGTGSNGKGLTDNGFTVTQNGTGEKEETENGRVPTGVKTRNENGMAGDGGLPNGQLVNGTKWTEGNAPVLDGEVVSRSNRAVQISEHGSANRFGASNQPKTVALHELELGRCYEVVLTNWSGLYRYRLEDVVRVEGFFHSLPQVSFQYRKGVLSIQGATEHMTEKDLVGAVLEVAEGLAATGHRLVEFTTTINEKSSPPRYTIFWELIRSVDRRAAGEEGSRLGELAADLDAALRRRNFLYENSIRKHELSPLELCMVRPGTFEAMFRYKVERQGVDAGQYKVPRCIKAQELREIFRDRTVQTSLVGGNVLLQAGRVAGS